MLFKKLTATGFKSFADKTEFDFGSGVTCIVGPNGCGKSNVVDAIKWVLGEQSAKSLRGTQMLDVIFNGSGTRKSMGLAQVDLTFDNSDGALPTDQREVVVSRRLYRSGESEYLLNKQVCRLKDIRELLLDTGVGVDAYSMIEQGRVDVLLQANPTERRMIFEEAAGINKYKARRKEAQRRLERVAQNLLRVQDIVDEVEKRLRSVKLAAGKARNYQEYTQALRELRSRYALAEYHRLRESRDEHDRQAATLSDEVTRIRTEISNHEARSSEANVGIVDLEREMTQAEGRLLTVQSQITAGEERIAAAGRRIADQSELLERSTERLGGFDDQLSVLDARLSEQRDLAASLETELSTIHAEQERLQALDHNLAAALHQSQTRREEEKATILDLVRRAGQVRNQLGAWALQRETFLRERGKLLERDLAIAAELGAAEGLQGELRTQHEETIRLIDEQNRRLAETREYTAAVTRERAALVDQHAAAKEYRSGLLSRRQVLEEMDSRHEGLLAGAREILERRDAAAAEPDASQAEPQTFSYVRGAVGELFEVDVAHARIVEAVLGSQEKHLVVASREALLNDRDALAELGGRIEAFCLDCTPPVIGGPDLTGQEGFIANLIDQVRYPEDCAQLARHLFSRTYVVESLDAARRLGVIASTGSRFVTLEGIVLEGDGRVSLGTLGSDTGLISRRSELRELARQSSEVDERITQLAEQLDQRAGEMTHLETVQQQLRAALSEAHTQRVEAQSRLARVEETVRRLGGERPTIASEVESLSRRCDEIARQEGAEAASLAELEQRQAAGERLAIELAEQIEGLAAERQVAAEQLTMARVRVGELSQRRAAAAESVRDLSNARIQLEADRDQAGRDVLEAKERIEQSGKQIEEARESVSTLTSEQSELHRRTTAMREQRDALRRAIDEHASEARRLRGELDRVDAELRERQMKLQEVRVRLEDLVARIASELSVDLEIQYAAYVPDQEEDWPAVEAQIDELRRKIERLGNVNLDAINEQAELEQRHGFLTTQMEDLRSSERQLTALIEKLNRESRDRFLETFAAVQLQFTAIFKKLFGGGKAEINLMDANDPLECGIEITARPPGKEPRSISLLSGGEKSLTAIALLMAVFRSRPAPFVLLDEVDAALDESNNVRFNHLVDEFSKISQFIVITHSKRTMSVADVMYGITMQEAGVSKRVSVRFDDQREETAVA